MIRKAAGCILLIFLWISLTGCWNNRDISEMAIATAFGIDRTEEGRAMVSVQIVKPSAARTSGTEGGGSDTKGFVVVSNTADTLFGALRGMLSKVNNKIFYSSSQVIVIGENAAKSGIKDLLDFILRDHETQYKTMVAVAKGTTAKEILEQEFDLSKVPGAYIRDTLENVDARALTKKMMLLEVARELVTDGRALSIATIEKVEQTTNAEGIAVFSMDRMVGWLDRYESRGYMFVAGRVKSTVLEIENPLNAGKQVAVEILSSSSDRKMKFKSNGDPAFAVKIKVQGNIGEQQDGSGMKEDEFIKVIAKGCDEKIKKEALLAIEKCQRQYKSDIFGFGMDVFDENPRYWKEIRSRWYPEIFPRVEVDVEVETKLIRSGLMNRSIEVQ